MGEAAKRPFFTPPLPKVWGRPETSNFSPAWGQGSLRGVSLLAVSEFLLKLTPLPRIETDLESNGPKFKSQFGPLLCDFR